MHGFVGLEGLTPFQIRSRLPFFTLSLFDEALHVPLLFVGKNIKHQLIPNQVSSVDIFPTIANLIDSPIKEKIHGKNLLPHSQKSNDEESAIYLHTVPYEKTSPDDRVGIRTQNYKYFRKYAPVIPPITSTIASNISGILVGV